MVKYFVWIFLQRRKLRRSIWSVISFQRMTGRRLDNIQIIRKCCWKVRLVKNERSARTIKSTSLSSTWRSKQLSCKIYVIVGFFLTAHQKRYYRKGLILCASKICLNCIVVAYRELLASSNENCSLWFVHSNDTDISFWPSPIIYVPGSHAPSSLLCFFSTSWNIFFHSNVGGSWASFGLGAGERRWYVICSC